MRRRISLLSGLALVFLVLVAVYFTLPGIFGSVVAPLPDEYQASITNYAEQYKVDSCLIAAIIRGESNWNPNASSRAGAQGLMQIIPGTASAVARRFDIDYDRGKIRDPDINIHLGVALLQYNMENYGTLRNILVAYNAGGARVKLPNNLLPRETQYYIVKIDRYYRLYSSLYPNFCTGPSVADGPAVGGAGVSGVTFPDFTPPENVNGAVDITNFWKSFLVQP